MIVKKDKNHSSSIYQILNSNKTIDESKAVSLLQYIIDIYQGVITKDKVTAYLDSLLEFLWTKISEKYVTIASAFRYFDI